MHNSTLSSLFLLYSKDLKVLRSNLCWDVYDIIASLLLPLCLIYSFMCNTTAKFPLINVLILVSHNQILPEPIIKLISQIISAWREVIQNHLIRFQQECRGKDECSCDLKLQSGAHFTSLEGIGRNLKAGQSHKLHLHKTDSKMFLVYLSYTKQTLQKVSKSNWFRAAVFTVHIAAQVWCEVELTVHGSENWAA